MSERFKCESAMSKYSHNGICKMRKVQKTIETDDGPAEWPIRSSGFYCGIDLKHSAGNKSMFLIAALASTDPSESSKIPSKTLIFLNVLVENPKFKNKFKIETFAEGDVEITGPYLWKFNLRRTIFDGESRKNMITYKMGRRRRLYSHKQLILFHDSQSKIFDETHKTDTLKLPSTFFEMKDFEKFLQVAHGVQLKLDSYDDSWGVIMIAHRYGIQNVLAYCERQLVMDFKEDPSKIPNEFYVIQIAESAIRFNFDRLLAFLLQLWMKNLEKWRIDNHFIFNSLNWGEMTNESMKIVLANVLYGEY